MVMDYKTELLAFLKKEEQTLTRSWEWAKDARDRAPSAAESHSDTTRSEQEKLVHALERDIKTIKGHIKEVEKMTKSFARSVGKWSYVELDNGGMEMKILIVPEGIGGKDINGVKLVSVASPLGSALLEKRMGDSVEINGRGILVREIE